ncbi:hypothetical protein HGM15179_020164 [Zosterops borbonicus]|uniref:Uncharacterized protein n=1 Tax=Zosterops borbonicus TaxID=364589 RepID=A0A8K1D9P8_9PASS|nr:hypothetical protein HGM15179_020164 [Zosterops borbonicus]
MFSKESLQSRLAVVPLKNILAAEKTVYLAVGGNLTGEGRGRGLCLWGVLLVLSLVVCGITGGHTKDGIRTKRLENDCQQCLQAIQKEQGAPGGSQPVCQVRTTERRGEKLKESELEQLALWARKNGKLNKPALLFSTTEWKEVGDLLCESTDSGGENRTSARDLGVVWQKVYYTLQVVSAEEKMAAAVTQAFEGAEQAKIEIPSLPSQKPARVARFFGICNRPICGLSASISPISQAETVSPQPLRRTESEPELARPPNSVGVETGGDSGGAEGGNGQSQVMQHRGRM